MQNLFTFFTQQYSFEDLLVKYTLFKFDQILSVGERCLERGDPVDLQLADEIIQQTQRAVQFFLQLRNDQAQHNQHNQNFDKPGTL